MKSKINQILSEIDNKRKELFVEYEKLKESYGFQIKNGRIKFHNEVKTKNKAFKESLLKYIFSAQIKHLISAPFIYMMVIPTIILDIFLFVYQHICFRLYNIPFVKRKDYIVYDKKHLDFLNVIQKFHCLYCSYVNGVFGYAVEIAGRTERYWCPIKHASKIRGGHDWEKYFADYGDPVGFRERLNTFKEFYKK